MNKKGAIIFVLAALLVGAGIVYAAQSWLYPQTAIIAPVDYIIYFEGSVWANGTAMNWGTLYPGNTYYYNLTIQSLVPSNTTVTMEPVSLPIGWNQTWSKHNTLISPLQTVVGNLTLTIPSNATAGDYSWNSIIRGEYT